MSLSGPDALAADGVWRVTTPLAYRPREVHAYLVRVPDGYLLVDGGAESAEGWAALDGGVRRVAGDWTRVVRQVATHMHMDHIGLVGRAVRESGAAVTMGRLDAERREHAAAAPEEEAAYRAELLRRAGAPPGLVERMGSVRAGGGLPFEVADRPDEARTPLVAAPAWQVVWTPGHTAGHIALFRPRDRVLICGDAVLPRVTPTIGVNRQREDPVADYRGSLARLRALDPVVALGGHGEVMGAPLERIAALEREIDREGERILDALTADRPTTVWTLVERRYAERDLPPVMWYQAVREIRAHLDHLVGGGAVTRVDGVPDSYRRAGPGLSEQDPAD